jgi:hypothetical protein
MSSQDLDPTNTEKAVVIECVTYGHTAISDSCAVSITCVVQVRCCYEAVAQEHDGDQSRSTGLFMK